MKNCLQSRIFDYFYHLIYELFKNDTKLLFYTINESLKFYCSWFFSWINCIILKVTWNRNQLLAYFLKITFQNNMNHIITSYFQKRLKTVKT
jgi:hypothetical protein